MATSDEIKAKILSRLAANVIKEMAYADLLSSLASTSADEKAVIMSHIRRNNPGGLGNAIMAIVKSQAKAGADTEANKLLANNVLDLDELEQVL